MTQPYPFTHTAATWHAKASAAKRLRSNCVLGNRSSLVGQAGDKILDACAFLVTYMVKLPRS